MREKVSKEGFCNYNFWDMVKAEGKARVSTNLRVTGIEIWNGLVTNDMS